MTKHYEFVPGDIRAIGPGRTVKRIRAVKEIASIGVAVGALGGYIEKEANLHDNAWVYGDAEVSGDARVYGDAKVFGTARVLGGARVSGNARINGDAKVFGTARVYGDAVVSGGARVYGNADVFGTARVSGFARVYGDALVSGNARVCGDAEVSGDALVSGDARVFRHARVSGAAQVIGNALLSSVSDHLLIGPAKSSGRFTTACRDEKIGVRVNCGCFSGSLLEFSQAIEKTHANNEEHLQQYRLFCQLIAFNFGVEGHAA